jgi:hypothetical protein
MPNKIQVLDPRIAPTVKLPEPIVSPLIGLKLLMYVRRCWLKMISCAPESQRTSDEGVIYTLDRLQFAVSEWSHVTFFKLSSSSNSVWFTSTIFFLLEPSDSLVSSALFRFSAFCFFLTLERFALRFYFARASIFCEYFSQHSDAARSSSQWQHFEDPEEFDSVLKDHEFISSWNVDKFCWLLRKYKTVTFWRYRQLQRPWARYNPLTSLRIRSFPFRLQPLRKV